MLSGQAFEYFDLISSYPLSKKFFNSLPVMVRFERVEPCSEPAGRLFRVLRPDFREPTTDCLSWLLISSTTSSTSSLNLSRVGSWMVCPPKSLRLLTSLSPLLLFEMLDLLLYDLLSDFTDGTLLAGTASWFRPLVKRTDFEPLALLVDWPRILTCFWVGIARVSLSTCSSSSSTFGGEWPLSL